MAEKSKLSVAEAVKAGWAARPTLYRAIKSGNLTAETAPGGRAMLDVSELVRLYGEPRNKRGKVSGLETGVASHLASEVEALKARLSSEQKETESLRERLSEAREREKQLFGQLEAQTRLLAAYGPKKGLWARLFGKGDKDD